MTDLTSLPCEKCQQPMRRAKVYRLSGCLVAVGFLLVAVAVASALLGVGIAAAALLGHADGPEGELRARAARELREIPVQEWVLDDFFDDGRVSEATLARLEYGDRLKVQAITHRYAQSAGAAAVGRTVGQGIAWGVVLALLGAALLLLILGLILLMRRKVWKCTACGYSFERA